MKTFCLPRALYRRLTQDAQVSTGVEICGLLAGDGENCTAAYPIDNISPYPEIAFYMDPGGQLAAMQAMEASGESMIGIYHSHPRTPAVPSPRDIDSATYPGLAYLIISTQDQKNPEVGAFILHEQGFETIALNITG